MMKRNILNVCCSMLMLMGTSLILTSCSDDDENDNKGAQQVEYLKAMVLDENGKVFFDATDIPNVYQLGLYTKEDAKELVKLYAGNNFTGQDFTRVLDDEKGTVTVSTKGEGVFYTVHFAVQGIPPFTLAMVSEGGNYVGVEHICPVCSYKWVGFLNRCPRTGNRNYHPQS